MINLNAIVQAAQDGEGINNLAAQFNITPQQAQEAVQALLPALSMGLQAQMKGPGFAKVLGHLATRQNQDAFDDSEAAQSDDTIASGTDAVNHLFGHADVTQQVAEQAAQHSTVGADLLQAMLPVVAAIVMGGLFKSIAAQGGLGGIFGQTQAVPAPQAPSGGGGLGDILGQMTGQQAPAAPQAQSGGGLGDILGQMTGQHTAPQAPPAQGGGGGLGDLLGGLLGGGKPGAQGGGGLGDILGQLAGGAQHGQAAAPAPQGGLGDLLGGLLGGGKPGAQGGGGLGDILGQLAGGAQHGQAAAPQGGGIGDLLGGLLGGGKPGAAGGGLEQIAIQAGLSQLQNMFSHGTNVSPTQQSGLDSILGQLLGGGRR